LRTKGLDLVIASLLVLGTVASCRERNPAYLEPGALSDAAVGADVPTGTADVPIEPEVSPDLPFGPEAPGDTPVVVDAPVDTPLGLDVVVDLGAMETDDARGDGRDGRRPEDAPDGRPRDTPETSSPDDAGDVPVIPLDGAIDGEASDAVPIDSSPLCQPEETRECAAPSNPLLGACRAGEQRCVAGAWETTCAGEVLPLTEICGNGLDDDCDGMTDEGCVEDCLVVGPAGDDATADGTVAHPFGTIAAALAAAAAVDGGVPRQVCVAAGTTCTEAKTYLLDAPLVIPNGARLQGNYTMDGTSLAYCGDARPPRTTLAFTTASGALVFPGDITASAEVGGFVIERFSGAAGEAADTEVRAVTVAGARQVVLSGLFITDAPAGQSTYGVVVESGGQVTITGSAITGGGGLLSAIGVEVGSGSVVLRNNCDQSAEGRCKVGCSVTPLLGIWGRNGADSATAGQSAAVRVGAAASPSTLVANTLCGGPTGSAEGATVVGSAALRCEKGNCAHVVGNVIEGAGGRFSVGVALTGGGGLLAGNAIRAACGAEAVLGVLLEGTSTRMENNVVVLPACADDQATVFRGLQVVLASTSREPDVHSNVIDPGGQGACASDGIAISRVEVDEVTGGIFRNNVVLTGGCDQATAVSEQEKATARRLEHNDLVAPPSSTSADSAVLYRRASVGYTAIEKVNALAGADGNLSVDPKFLAYPGDLRLTGESPCIDQGTALGAPADDADGQPRPQGQAYDIGAFESVSP